MKTPDSPDVVGWPIPGHQPLPRVDQGGRLVVFVTELGIRHVLAAENLVVFCLIFPGILPTLCNVPFFKPRVPFNLGIPDILGTF